MYLSPFKAEVENKLGKIIKLDKSKHGGEYYGRYDWSSEQRPRLFARYLEECEIVPRYTMIETLSQKGVAKTWN